MYLSTTPPHGPGLACELEGDQLTFVVPARPYAAGAISRSRSRALGFLLFGAHLGRAAPLALLGDDLSVHE